MLRPHIQILGGSGAEGIKEMAKSFTDSRSENTVCLKLK